MDAVLLFAIALLAAPLAVVHPLPTLTAVALVAIFARPKLRPFVVAAVLLVACAAAARVSRAIAESEARREEARVLFRGPARCEAEATLVASSVAIRGGYRVAAELDGLFCDGARVPLGRVRAALYFTAKDEDVGTSSPALAADAPETLATSGTSDGASRLHAALVDPEDLRRGDRLAVVAQLAVAQRFWVDGLGDARVESARAATVLSGGVFFAERLSRAPSLLSSIDAARNHVRRRIAATFAPDLAPMARALVLGENDLVAEDDEAFRTSGLSHLLAVSGAHLVIVVLSAVAFLRHVLLRSRWACACDVGRVACAVGIPLSWAYAAFAGASGSAVRAAWMLSAGLLARAMGRRGDARRALSLSVVAQALVDPLVAFDVSFMLSAAATAGLLVLGPELATRLEALAPRVPAAIVRAASATVAATVPCTPLLLLLGPTVPLGGVVANLLAAPVGEAAALPLCLVHAVLAPVPALEEGAAAAASGALALVRHLARAFSSSPWLAPRVPPPSGFELAALVVAAFAASIGPGVRRARAFVVATALFVSAEVCARSEGAPTGVLRVTFLDVGQGDSALVDFPDGSSMLVDAGGLVGSPIDTGARVVRPLLRARRRARVDVAVLSHPHPDHYLGFAAALSDVEVGAFWDVDLADARPDAQHAELLGSIRSRGIPVFTPAAVCGRHAMGGAVVEVLAPCPEPTPARGANDNSFVLRLVFGGRAVLLVGDAEHEEESELVARYGDGLRADVLKVGHHGSRTSTTRPFLAAVSPRVAVISSGVRNRFGHPHAQTLRTLHEGAVTALRTDEVGAVVVETDGDTLSVRSARDGHVDVGRRHP